MNKSIEATITRKFWITGHDIFEWICEREGIDAQNIASYRVVFDVPSGGDYSGMTLDITAEDPIRVVVEEIRDLELSMLTY